MILKQLTFLLKIAANAKLEGINATIFNFSNVAKIQSELEKKTTKEFAYLIAPMLFELSIATDKPYHIYLQETQDMLLSGKSESEVLWYYDQLMQKTKNKQ